MSESIGSLENSWNEAQRAEAHARHDRNRKGGDTGNGNPPGGGDLEARVAKLEAHAEYIRRDLDSLREDVREFRGETKSDLSTIKSDMRTDFRLVFGALIVAAIGLAGVMAKGFGWLS